MPEFLTYSTLQTLSAKITLNESTILGRAESKYRKSTFLSHSSKDKTYLTAVITFLENYGADVYVDNGDTRLPERPSKITAEILRETINELRRFIIFVTHNSKDSRWIPWELGLGDAFKGPSSIALLPASESAYSQDWANQEYLGLYQRIVYGTLQGFSEPVWFVHDHIENKGTELRTWLTGR